MNGSEPLKRTVAVCLVAAALSLAVGQASGHGRAGLAVALGLTIGSAQGFLARWMLRLEFGFAFTSVGRLAILTAAGLGLVALLGIDVAPFVLGGLALSQLVLAVMSAITAVRT